MRNHPSLATGLLALAALESCAAPAERIDFEEARSMFEERGVQAGEPLPELSLVDLHGQPVDLAAHLAGRPAVLVTASLTCNVARRRQPELDALRDDFAGRAAVIVIYTIEAHPKHDPCPYTGSEWVPKANERDEVLVRQPRDARERATLARDYRDRFGADSLVVVDTMDDASWHALGRAPNLGLLVDSEGIVRLRQGWFEPDEMRAALEREF